MADPFKYNVAISFLASDELLAIEIAKHVTPSLKTFIFSERQLEIVGVTWSARRSLGCTSTICAAKPARGGWMLGCRSLRFSGGSGITTLARRHPSLCGHRWRRRRGDARVRAGGGTVAACRRSDRVERQSASRSGVAWNVARKRNRALNCAPRVPELRARTSATAKHPG